MSIERKNFKKRQYRCYEIDEDEKTAENPNKTDEPDRLLFVLQDIHELQKTRSRSSGLSSAELALGREVPKDAQLVVKDPLKLRTGGVIVIKSLRQVDIDQSDIEDDIKKQFARESHLRDEDEEMRKYVEEEVNRRTGKSKTGINDINKSTDTEKRQKIGDDVLFSRAVEKLKHFQSKPSDQMLSNQMLSGIPEVDLGIEARIKNIEETEAMKQRLLKEATDKQRDLEKSTAFNQDIVKDIAQDYVRHRIFDIVNSTEIGREDWKPKLKRPNTESVAVVGEDTPKLEQRPVDNCQGSDDRFHAKRFKQKIYQHKNEQATKNWGSIQDGKYRNQ